MSNIIIELRIIGLLVQYVYQYVIEMKVYHTSIETLFKMEMAIKWNIKMIIYLT